MASSSAHGPPELCNVKGLHVILVEESWHAGVGLKNLLQAWEVDVAGPVATTAEAVNLIAEHVPDVAFVDLNLGGGGRRSRYRDDRLLQRSGGDGEGCCNSSQTDQ